MPTGPGALLAEVAEQGDNASLMAAIRDTLRSWVGVGPVFLASADPVSGAFTGTFAFDVPDDAAAAFFAIETSGRDVVSFQGLATAPNPIGSLYAATDAVPASSERWREVISPLGWGDELRAAVRANASTWGYLCLHREAGERPFTHREIARVGALLPAIAAALRTAALASFDAGTRAQTGLVLVDAGGRIIGTTGAAQAWLDELGPRPPDGLPLLLAGLARMVLDSGRPAASTLTTAAGRIGLVDAAPVRNTSTPQVAVLIGPAAAAQLLDRLAAASSLTVREREVVSCVLDGLSTRLIAARLGISPGTVQAHLTSVFAKTGLRSRRELVRRLSR